MYFYPIMILCIFFGLVISIPIIRLLRACQNAHQCAKRGL